MQNAIYKNLSKTDDKRLSRILFLFCFSVSLVGMWIANYVLMNHDFAAITAFAEDMLKGRRLYQDLITSQFPLIIYIAMVPIGIHHISGISVPGSFFVFMFFLLQFCVLLSWKITRHNTIYRALVPSYILLFCFYYAAFLLPFLGQASLNTFGQKEHFFCVLCLPYFMTVINRIQNIQASSSEKVIAAVLAAIGFGIKPQFTLLFVISELFMLISQRRLPWKNLDVWLILVLLTIYYLSMIFFMPDYFSLIPNLALNYKGYEGSWDDIIITAIMSFLAPAIIVFCFRRSSQFSVLLFLSLLIAGGEALYIVPKLFYYYHLLPVYFLSVILFVFAALASKRLVGATLIILLFSFYVSVESQLPDLETIVNRRKEVLEETALIAPYKTICFFNTDDIVSFPAVTYAGSSWGLGFSYLEYLPVSYLSYQPFISSDKTIYKETPYHTLETMGKNERFFHEKVISDLQRLPDAIVVDEGPYIRGFYEMKFNYIKYFMQDPRFRKIWSHYELATRFHRKYDTSFYQPVDATDAIYRRKD